MTAEYRRYLKSEEWASVKLDLYQIRGKKCEKCESKNKLEIHHLTYKNIFKEEPSDLIILCNKCHYKEHFTKKGKKKVKLSAKQSLIRKVNTKNRKIKKRKLLKTNL